MSIIVLLHNKIIITERDTIMPQMILAGAGEKLQYILHDYNDNTIRFILRYPGLIDPDTLCAATKAVIEKTKILHGSFYNDALNAYWIIREDYEESTYFQYIQTDGDPCITARSLALVPISTDGPTQLRCYLVQNNKESALALCISHLCVDGGDGKYLLEKLIESYNMVNYTGSGDDLEIKSGNRAPEQIYEGLSLKEIASLVKMPGSAVKSEFRFADEEPGRKNMIWATIPAETMSNARKRAKTIGATANDLLLTAMYRAYAAVPGIDANAPVSVMSMIDLRRHCDDGESDGLGNMSGTFPTTLMEGVHGSFTETLIQISEQTRQMKEDPLAGLDSLPLVHGALRTMPMKVLLLAAGKVYGSFSLGLTNLGNFDCRTFALGDLIPSEGLFGGPLKKKPGMQVSASSFNGACALSIVGQYSDADVILLENFLSKMVEEVSAYAVEE